MSRHQNKIILGKSCILRKHGRTCSSICMLQLLFDILTNRALYLLNLECLWTVLINSNLYWTMIIGYSSDGSQSLRSCNLLTSFCTLYFGCAWSSPSFTFAYWIWLHDGVQCVLNAILFILIQVFSKYHLYDLFWNLKDRCSWSAFLNDELYCVIRKDKYCDQLWSSY